MLFLENFLKLALDAAPWLVLGLLIGGLIKSIMPTVWLEKHLKGDGFWPVVKAALLGAPLPLCSCGVLPAAIGLRKAGASKSATTSFLISTPETGVDSVMVTYALLGPLMAITRPIAAILSAITAGLLVGKSEQIKQVTQEDDETQPTRCCATKKKPEPVSCCSKTAEQEPVACCSKTDVNDTTKKKLEKQDSALFTSIQYAFTDLLAGIIIWLLIGLAFSAAIQTWLSADFLTAWGSGLPAMLVMIAISIPMYVCATASTPIAAGLMMSGVSAGTVLVFLLAGPASNIGSLGVIKKELGRRALIAYLSGVAVVAIVSGLLLDAFVQSNNIDIQAQLQASEQMLPLWLSWLGLGVIVIASGRLAWKKVSQD
ncbi:MAG TPA: permease [Thiothrix sp.]|nr:permease [Thiothrix sp.]